MIRTLNKNEIGFDSATTRIFVETPEGKRYGIEVGLGEKLSVERIYDLLREKEGDINLDECSLVVWGSPQLGKNVALSIYRAVKDETGRVVGVDPSFQFTYMPCEDLVLEYKIPLREVRAIEGVEGCFITTAVMEQGGERELNILRNFRDSVMKKSSVGRILVDVYYKISPSIAFRLRSRPVLKKLIRNLFIAPCARLLKFKDGKNSLLQRLINVIVLIIYILGVLFAAITVRLPGSKT